MAGKKYGLEDKYKMMYGGMTNSPVRANIGLFIKAGVAGAKYGAKKIAQSLAKSKDINVGSTLNKARDVSKYDTSTLTDKGAFVKRSLQSRARPLTADTLKKSNSGKFSKTAKIGAIGGAGAVAIAGTNEAKKDYSKLSQSEEFKKGREEGAKKSKELGEKIKNKAGKIVGYLIGKRMGGLQDEKLKPGAMYKASKGVMAKKNLKKAALVGVGLLASNYLGKRAGEADASRIALGIDKPETTSAFGVNINPTRFKNVKGVLDKEGGMYYKAKGGMYKVKK
jgi:hypothetical protein